MKNCETCRWYMDFPDERCDNADSDRFLDWVDMEDTCEEWEEIENDE